MCIYQEITNAWINQSTKKPKSSRMFFENDKLYSYGYHYVIARIDRERNIVLINSTKSTPTTNRHKYIVADECFAKELDLFNVPNPSTNLEYNLHRLRDNLQSAIDAANKHMIKPNMQAAETIADDFDALAKYMRETTNIMNTMVYTDSLALKDRYNAKRSK